MKTADNDRRRGKNGFVYSDAPFLIYWELTRACELACFHCRAEAVARRDPSELATGECRAVLRMVAAFGERRPHLILTGGNPLMRPDFFALLDYGRQLGLRMSVAPSGTEDLTRDVLRSIKAGGVESISLSLDGSSADRHDGFRGVPGCFGWTIAATRAARAEGLPLQVNTLVTAETDRDLPEIYDLVRGLDPRRWSLFFLVSVGRGRAVKPVSSDRAEEILNWLYDLSVSSAFTIATTEALHFRRVVTRRMRAEGAPMARIRGTAVGRGFGIRDGNGIMFVSHTGEVYPSGFLPLVAGDVRTADLAEIYRESELFKRIRSTGELKGRCGVCEFREICGGSRARAFSVYGDCMAEDPACSYRPGRYRAVSETIVS